MKASDYIIMDIHEIKKFRLEKESDEDVLIRIANTQGRIPIAGTFKSDQNACGEYGGKTFKAVCMRCE